MPAARKVKPKPKQLLVEGKNDRHVIWALCEQYQLPEEFSVEVPEEDGVDQQGIDVLLRGLPDRLKQETLQTLGIVVDADQELQGRWNSLCDRLRFNGYPDLPTNLPDAGLICPSPNLRLPKLGIWLMPNNQLPGMLEDFVACLVPPEDALLARARAILAELEAAELHRYSLVHRPKALIHTWLAWQDKPGMPMGQAITAKVLHKDAELAQRFVTWLHHLFDLPTAVLSSPS
jgi:hypothetical protein